MTFDTQLMTEMAQSLYLEFVSIDETDDETIYIKFSNGRCIKVSDICDYRFISPGTVMKVIFDRFGMYRVIDTSGDDLLIFQCGDRASYCIDGVERFFSSMSRLDIWRHLKIFQRFVDDCIVQVSGDF